MSHSDETDPFRIQQIINRALEDAEWLLKKVLYISIEMCVASIIHEQMEN